MKGGDTISLLRIISVLGMMPLLSCGDMPSGEAGKYYYVVQSNQVISYEDGRVFRIYVEKDEFIKEEI